MEDAAEITELRLGPPGGSLESKKRALEAVEDESSTTKEGCGGGARDASPEKSRVVGWPPVCFFRQRHGRAPGAGKNVSVKVSVDAVPFLRKVDLGASSGYAKLTAAVEELFGRRGLGRDDPKDTEGGWMLVGDVPWEEVLVTGCFTVGLAWLKAPFGASKA